MGRTGNPFGTETLDPETHRNKLQLEVQEERRSEFRPVHNNGEYKGDEVIREQLHNPFRRQLCPVDQQ